MTIRQLFRRKPTDELQIPVTAENRRRLIDCRAAISRAKPFEALRELSGISQQALETECIQLEARMNQLDSRKLKGLLSVDEASLEFNRINDSLLTLVRRLERAFEQDEKNHHALRKNLQLRYAERLRQKLGERQPVNIRRFYSTVGTTPIGAAAYKDVVVPDTEVQQTMLETFDASDGRLLVIGQPGVGKTTLLLQLALALLEERPDHITAVLNLATWRLEYGSFESWLEHILPLELGASRALAKQVRQNASFMLLLDGLDEVPEEARDACLSAIGHYGAQSEHRFVISSRISEYQNAGKDAPVNLQIEMRPLSAEQIEQELASAGPDRPEALRLRVALQHDKLLREAVATPFYLNTAQILFAEGLNWDEMGFTATDAEGRKQELVKNFVENRLQYLGRRPYPPQKSGKWLTFLANKMKEENIAVFELVNLQPRWMPRRLFLFSIIFSIVNGVAMGLFFFLTILILAQTESNNKPGSEVDPVITICLFVGVGIIASFIRSQTKNEIKTDEVRTWRWANFKQNWRKSIVFFAIGMIYLFDSGPTFSLRSFILGIAGVLSSFAIAGYKISPLIQINKPYQRFNASLRNGAFPIIDHVCLRLAFFLEGLLPLYLVHFLNEMAERHVLESDGGSWRFRHKILQDYFVEKRAG